MHRTIGCVMGRASALVPRKTGGGGLLLEMGSEGAGGWVA